jgi:hypothetical protein
MANTKIGNIKGPTGATGPQGPIGNTGPAGSQGPIGNTGSQGPQGPTGSAGPAGSTGPPGMLWRGAWSSGTAYALNDTVSQAGSSYICIAANTNNAPPNATYWQLVAQIGAAGPTGATGSQGPTGNTGPTGPQGPIGNTGPTGAQGPPGTAGTTGPTGATGVRGSYWYTGSGAPPTPISGSIAGDLYLDTATGDVWQVS